MQHVSERLTAANTRVAALEMESADTAERALIAQVESDQLYSAGELQVLPAPLPPSRSHEGSVPPEHTRVRIWMETSNGDSMETHAQPALPHYHGSCSRKLWMLRICRSTMSPKHGRFRLHVYSTRFLLVSTIFG